MPQPLFDEEVAEEFAKYHFKIRDPVGIGDSKFECRFDIFMEDAMHKCKGHENPILITKKNPRVLRDEGVVFVKVKLSDSARRHNISFPNAIKDLCESITDPKARSYVTSLTHRSLLGVSAVHKDIEVAWRDALFKTTFKNGPEYLKEIEVAKSDYIPAWSLALSFTFIAGIQILTFQVATRMPKWLAKNSPVTWKERLVELFGICGVTAAGKFFQKIILGREADGVDGKHKGEYLEAQETLYGKIEDVLSRIEAVRTSPASTTDIHQRLSEVMDACYSATIAASQAMVANKAIFESYVQLRKEATKGMVQGAAGVFAGATNAALCCQVVAAPLAQVSATQVAAAAIGVAKWPTVIAIGNPIGFWIGVAAAGVAAISYCRESTKKAEIDDAIKDHKKATILICRAQGLAHETILFLHWIYNFQKSGRPSESFLQDHGGEGVVERWRQFVADEERESQQRKAEGDKKKHSTRTKSKKHGHEESSRHAGKHEKGKRVSLQERQVLRYIKVYIQQQGDELNGTLHKLRGGEDDSRDGSHDESDDGSDDETRSVRYVSD